MTTEYATSEPTREAVDALQGPVLIEFGTSWCGHCAAAQPLLAKIMADYPQVQHLKIEDAAGRRLGRSFQVKLWPTLIFSRDGKTLSRLVRPTSISELEEAFEQLTGEC
ncbi:thioredoxin family protein [Pseudomonas sp. NA-150]|uniref:thioredoxin family protein n=1 Tax=Pseudomonas sp. NA-150 TaxID=3367525 RepID=UPI0037C61226